MKKSVLLLGLLIASFLSVNAQTITVADNTPGVLTDYTFEYTLGSITSLGNLFYGGVINSNITNGVIVNPFTSNEMEIYINNVLVPSSNWGGIIQSFQGWGTYSAQVQMPTSPAVNNGDVIKIKFIGIFNNPTAGGTYTFNWGTKTYSGGVVENFSALVTIASPPPAITSFSPTSGEVGTSVTITGTDFDATASNNTVYFGAVKATVTASTTTSLTVTVPSGSTYEPITVTTGGFVAQSSLVFNVTNSAISSEPINKWSFSEAQSYVSSSGVGSWHMKDRTAVIVDFDGDGKPDVAKIKNDGNVKIHLNTATIGDISANTFATGIDIAGSTCYGSTVASGDFDGDGKIDLIFETTSNTMAILRNSSSGIGNIAFDAVVNIDVSSVYAGRRVRVADFDGDGKLDIAVSYLYSNSFNIWLNTSSIGSVSFNPTYITISGLNSGCRSFQVGDINMDGKSDVIWGADNGGQLLLNTTTAVGSPSFDTPISTSTSGNQFTIADYDGDGDNDFMSNGGSLRINNISGTVTAASFSSATVGSFPGSLKYISSGDFNGDGKIDIAAADNSYIRFWLNDYTSSPSSTSFTTATAFSAYEGNTLICDFDGDGKQDIFSAESSQSKFNIYKNIIGEPLNFYPQYNSVFYATNYWYLNSDFSYNNQAPTDLFTQSDYILNLTLTGANNFTGLYSNLTVSNKIIFSDATLQMNADLYHTGIADGITANAYFKTITTGNYKRDVSSTVVNFGIGNSTYNPVSITNNTGTDDVYSVRVSDRVNQDGSSSTSSWVSLGLNSLQRQWVISKDASNATSGTDITFNWNTSDDIEGTINTPALFIFDGTDWVKQTTGVTVTGTSITIAAYTGVLSNTQFAVADDVAGLMPPGITVAGTLSGFTKCTDAASSIQSFDASASGLTANITIAALTGIEYSLDNATFSSTLTLAQTSGTVSTTTVYVRMTAAANASISGNISLTSTGVTTETIAVSGTVNTLPTASIAKTNVSCYTGSDGTATVTASGGGGSYTYSWDTTPTQTTASISGLSAGTYTCTITDANGCTTTTSLATITQPTSALSATTVKTNVSCNGGSDGTATVTGLGGNGSYTYSWDSTPVQTTVIATGLSVGSYTCTVTDANGCVTTTSSVIITEPTVLSATTVKTNVSCNGDSDGTATVTALGGSGSYTYSWDSTPIQTTAIATGLPGTQGFPGTTYTVTVTDVNGCTTTAIALIKKPSLFSVTTAVTVVSCNGGSDGTATVTTIGGTGAPTISWNTSPVQTSLTATSLLAGTYTITATDGNGCIATESVIVTEPVVLSASISASNTGCLVGNNGTATVTPTGGTGTYTYLWDDASTQNTATATGLSAGTLYTCTITDANNCSTTTNITLTADVTAPTITAPADVTVNVDASSCTTAFANVTFGSPTTADDCSVASTTNNAPATFLIGTTTVIWTVTDAAGNTATATQVVTVVDNINPTITAPAAVSVNVDTGICTATGVTLGTATTADNCSVVSTTNDAPTTFPLGTTTVTYTVTDGSGNTATATQIVTVVDNINPTITAPIAVSANVNAGTCGALATGFTLGTATTADNCSVASTTNDAPITFPLGTTTVTWIVTDGSGNTATATQVVTVVDNELPIVLTQNATVQLDAFGQAVISSTMIDNGTTDNCSFTLTVTPNILGCSNIGVNTVILIATDNSGNQAFLTALVTVEDNISPSISAPADVTVNADANTCFAALGNIDLGSSINSDNCSVASITNDAASFDPFPVGNTTVTWTVIDGSGNIETATQVVTVNPVANPPSTSITSCDTYTWSSNSTTYTTSGTYINTTTLTGGCTIIETLVLTINNSTTSSITASSCDSYIWNGTSYLNSGVYTYTTSNSNGCDSTATLNLTINSVTTSSINITSCDSYLWNGTAYTVSGIYTYATTNSNGCDSTATLNLTLNNNTSTSTSITACDTYTWSANGTTYTTSGTYIVTGTTPAGCIATETLVLTINNSTTSSTTTSSCDSYLWNGTTYTTDGVYTYVTTNTVGCDSTATLNLTINYASTSSINITSCDSYLWNGTAYTVSGVYTYATTNSNGCDSTATLNLTLNNSTSTSMSITVCDTYTWSANGTTYTASGTYINIATTPAGCTLTETLVLTINNSTTSNVNITVCDSYSWNGTTYSNSGIYLYTATNANGCDSTAILTLMVSDIEAPVVIAPVDVIVNTNLLCESIGVVLVTPVVSDNCGIAQISNDALTLYPLGTTTVTWVVTDNSGNTTTVTQLVTVVDNEAPTLVLPSDLQVISNSGCDAIDVILDMPITDDNCGVASVVNDAPVTFLLGTTAVTWTVTDNSGNEVTGVQLITVSDMTSPTALLTNITITLPIGDNAIIDSSMIDLGSTDNCSSITFDLSQTTFSCSDLGINEITVVITDEAGNSTVSIVFVTVVLSGIDSDFDGIDDSCDDFIKDYVDVPSGFTPDSDGFNDKFVITDITASQAKLHVYNRYGNLVYQNQAYDNTWDGTSSENDMELPDGTYFYVLEIDGAASKTGYVYINRIY